MSKQDAAAAQQRIPRMYSPLAEPSTARVLQAELFNLILRPGRLELAGLG